MCVICTSLLSHGGVLTQTNTKNSLIMLRHAVKRMCLCFKEQFSTSSFKLICFQNQHWHNTPTHFRSPNVGTFIISLNKLADSQSSVWMCVNLSNLVWGFCVLQHFLFSAMEGINYFHISCFIILKDFYKRGTQIHSLSLCLSLTHTSVHQHV